MSKKGGSSKFFSEDSARFTIQPKTVLIMSLVYIGLVVLLHIYSKVSAPPKVVPEAPETKANEETPFQE